MRPDPKARCVEYKRIQTFLRATGTWHTFPLPHTPSLPPEREREREGGIDLVAGNSRVTKDGGLRISSCGEGGAIGVLGRSGPKARKLELGKTKWKLPSRRNFPFRVFSRSGENAIGEASAVGEASTELSCRLLFLLLGFSSKMKPARYTFRIPSLFMRYLMQSVSRSSHASTRRPRTQASNSVSPFLRCRFRPRRPMDESTPPVTFRTFCTKEPRRLLWASSNSRQ